MFVRAHDCLGAHLLKSAWLFGRLFVWAHDCSGACLFGRMIVWAHVCLGTWLFGRMIVWAHACLSACFLKSACWSAWFNIMELATEASCCYSQINGTRFRPVHNVVPRPAGYHWMENCSSISQTIIFIDKLLFIYLLWYTICNIWLILSFTCLFIYNCIVTLTNLCHIQYNTIHFYSPSLK